MTFDFEAVYASMRDPQMRHAIAVHLPAALAMLGFLAALLSAVLSGKRAALRGVTLSVYVLLVVTAWLAVLSGESARAEITRLLPGEVHDIVVTHEAMAEKTWALALITAILVLAGCVAGEKLKRLAAWLAVIGALATAGWVAQVAHYGGVLVYEHGVGTAASTAFIEIKPSKPPGVRAAAIEPKPAAEAEEQPSP